MLPQLHRKSARSLLSSSALHIAPRNPFDGVSVGTSTNDEQKYFIDRNTFTKVTDTYPNWQWKKVGALTRYGGLRCSSEVTLLKWSDIDWDENRFKVTSPKTGRCGKKTRIVPLFPELRKCLVETSKEEDADEKWVVRMLSGKPSKNLGTTFKKIVHRDGVDVWPKPFQNLRASRQTELEREHTTHVVCDWLGNTPTIAHKHYLTTTEDDFKRAVGRLRRPKIDGCRAGVE
ncbi:MAG: site-specific integrase [Pirellulales bacterium]